MTTATATKTTKMGSQTTDYLACEETLLGALAAGGGGGGGGGRRRACYYVSWNFEFHLQFPRGSPSTELSDFHQSALSENERECKQTLKNTCQG